MRQIEDAQRTDLELASQAWDRAEDRRRIGSDQYRNCGDQPAGDSSRARRRARWGSPGPRRRRPGDGRLDRPDLWIGQTYGPEALAARDRALLLLGFAGAFRRSELVGLDIEDLKRVDQGLVVRIGSSKGDQEGEGMAKGIPESTPKWCPVEAVEEWKDVGGRAEGPLFVRMDRWGNTYDDRLSGRAVARIVKKAAEGIGRDPDGFSAHSLRAGFATSAAEAGKPERAIMQQTGHRSLETVRGS